MVQQFGTRPEAFLYGNHLVKNLRFKRQYSDMDIMSTIYLYIYQVVDCQSKGVWLFYTYMFAFLHTLAEQRPVKIKITFCLPDNTCYKNNLDMPYNVQTCLMSVLNVSYLYIVNFNSIFLITDQWILFLSWKKWKGL